MNITLRPYQKVCVDKLLWEKRANLEGNSICVLPTAAGKSVIIANFVHQLNEPVLILQPTKEILEQNYEKLLHYMDKSEIGIYSASMNSKEIGKITLATIGSIYKNPKYFSHFDFVILDECHKLNPRDLSGMFNTFLKQIGDAKVVGFTATPYRQDILYTRETNKFFATANTTTKLINRMKGFFWKRILFNISMQELIDQGYLCKLVYSANKPLIKHENIPLNKTHSEFDLDSYNAMMEPMKNQILQVIFGAELHHNNVLVFCSTVQQADELSSFTPNSAVVTSKTSKKERDKIITGFKDGVIKTVYNVGVLTTGFDHPALDCIVLLRPTRSIALYVQMVGRGLRNSPGKTHCTVIDLADNVNQLGRVETFKVEKQGKWELVSEKGSWHNKILFSFDLENKKVNNNQDHKQVMENYEM